CCQMVPPAELAAMLRGGELDAALLSASEVLACNDYAAVDGIGIVSIGPVKSVVLAHREPLDKLQRIHLEPASRSSVKLLAVLLAERGLRPEFVPLLDYRLAPECSNVLLIGNPAIEFQQKAHEHEIWDLGGAWHELTGLPFVYALWAVRRSLELDQH